MKNTLLFIFLMLPSLSFAQKKGDYERAMSRFMYFYNRNKPDSINHMFADPGGKNKIDLWTVAEHSKLLSDDGIIYTYTYLGIDPASGETVFKAITRAKKYAVSFSLNANNKITCFNFKTNSPFIDSMMQHSQ